MRNARHARCYPATVAVDSQRILVTGSNGHLGRRLIAAIRQSQPDLVVRALVRSQRAAGILEEIPEADRPQEICIADYPPHGGADGDVKGGATSGSAEGLARAAADCQSVVHLVGIIKETANTSYAMAHEGTCHAIAQAATAAGVEHIVYLSLFGASPGSDNECLASRGRAEAILASSAARSTIMRVPMVLGRGDDAARALANMSRGRIVPLMGGGATLQQPIDARDVIKAILAALESSLAESRVLYLGGPESLSHRELLVRAAKITGGNPLFLSVPFALVRGIAALLERLSPHPPLTRAWLGVLQHDDRADVAEACKQLGIELTPLDDTLHHCLSEESETA